MMTAKSAPTRLERAPEATVRLSFTRSEAEKHGLLDRYESALAIRARRAARKIDAASRLQAVISQAYQHAQTNDWSHRRLLRQAGVSWGTWTRLEQGRADPVVWLPKIQAALNRVFEAKH